MAPRVLAERVSAHLALGRVMCVLTLLCGVVAVMPPRAAADAPLSLAPTSGLSGALVTVTPGFAKPSPCAVVLDDEPAQTFTCGPDVSVQLPVRGNPGPHTITVCTPSCDGTNPAESATFAILVSVPNLTGLTVDEVRKELLGVGLTSGQVTGTTGDPATTVSAQDPDTGTAVTAGSPVDITLGAAAPTPVRVPKLIGLTVRGAIDVLNPLGLRLGPAPSHGYVTAQSPAPGTPVPPESEVSVTVRTSVPVRLVSVPDVRGDSVARARQALSAAGLVLSTTATSGIVVTQTLAPRRRVPRGSTVSVTVRPIVAITNTSTTASKSLTARYGEPAAIVLILLLLLLTAGLVSRHVRNRNRNRNRIRGQWTATGPVPRVISRATGAGVGMRSLGPPPGPPVEFRTSRSSTVITRRKP